MSLRPFSIVLSGFVALLCYCKVESLLDALRIQVILEHGVVLKRNSAKLKMTTPFTDTTNLITADHILKAHSDLEHRFKTTLCSRIT